MKHLLKMSDLTRNELYHILDTADALKAAHRAGADQPLLRGKSVALLFSKLSTRTRTSFEVGVYQLGGLGCYLNTETELQSVRGEPLKDTARVLGRYYDAIVWRTYQQAELELLARYAGVPVINGLTDYAHPCQVLADLQTIRAYKGGLEDRKLAYVGDGNNMCNSLIVGGLLAGMQVSVACPAGYFPAADVLALAEKYGAAFSFGEDPQAAVAGADVVATDAWVSMNRGAEAEADRRRRVFRPYQVNEALLAGARPDVMVQHCLPAHHGQEITDAVFEAHAAEIFDEAENRLHVEKAVLSVLLAGG